MLEISHVLFNGFYVSKHQLTSKSGTIIKIGSINIYLLLLTRKFTIYINTFQFTITTFKYDKMDQFDPQDDY